MSPANQIWSRIVAPNEPDLPAEVAQYFLSIGFSEEDTARYTELAGMEQRDLSPQERSELEALVSANTLLMLLQAKARLSLKPHQPAA